MKKQVLNLLKQFSSNEIDRVELIKQLRKIKAPKGQKELWFRFSGSNLVTTINDLELDLSNFKHPNYRHTLEWIGISLNRPDDFEVHYS